MADLPPQLQRALDGGIAAIAATVRQQVIDLPLKYQLDIIRAIASGDASFSDGVDALLSGADQIANDLDDLEEDGKQIAMLTRAQAWDHLESTIPELAPLTAKARQLNPDMWPDLGGDK